jgi:hypothetical protein
MTQRTRQRRPGRIVFTRPPRRWTDYVFTAVIVPALLAWSGWLTLSALAVRDMTVLLPRLELKLDKLMDAHLVTAKP